MEYKITHEQLEKIINYLANKPYYEVVELIKIMTTLKKIKTTETNKNK